MREAIGGALLIKLVMFFIVIYICFFTIAINYSITFRVKNQIINLIEAYEGYDNAKVSVDDFISKVQYYRSVAKTTVDKECPNNLVTSSESGYCIERLTDDVDGNKYYYKVTTYVSFDFPIIGSITQFPVSGESKIFYE